MTEKDIKKHQQIEKQVSSFIDEVGLYSDEHINYIEKLNNVLEEMKSSDNSFDRKNYPSFYETVKSFELYVKEKKIVLTPHEKERLTVIASSGLNSMAKKRMAEDLIHAVKERHTSEVELRISDEKKKKEISELSKSRSFFVNWYNLFRFSLDYGTITLFTHRLKGECLDRLRINAASWFAAVKADIKKCLDQYYFYLSVLEYNSLVVLYELGNSLSEMKSVPANLSYNAEELYEVMNRFTSLYISISVNIRYIDSGLRKVYKDQNPGHGFWGFIGLLTDRPLVNGKVIRYNHDEVIRESIRGVLLSYYTVYAGVSVRTMHQLMYLAGEDGLIDAHEKELTEEAIKDQSQRETRDHGESSRIMIRLSEISGLVGDYREEGISLAARIYAVEAKGNLNQWARESESRPFFRIIKIFEGLKKYITDIIRDSGSFILLYDDTEYRNYFDIQPDLVKAVLDFSEFADELQGSREKDLSGLRIDGDVEKDAIIRRLLTADLDPPNIPGARALRETLLAISAKSYNLCMRFNDIINMYNQRGKTQSPDLIRNFDFFLNAKIVHPKIRGVEIILNRRDIVLADLIRAGCAVCEFIAESLQHPGIKAVQDEVAKLREENVERMSASAEAAGVDAGAGSVTVKKDQGDDVYTDRLTGLKNWAYFEDVILPGNYNEDHKYPGGVKRHIFCMEISNLAEINRKSGNDAGDAAYKKLSLLTAEIIKHTEAGNIAIRGRGGIIIGYITGVTTIDAVDQVHSILKKMNNIVISGELSVSPDPLINAGVYTESPGTNAIMNIEIVKKIMLQASDGQKGHVAFLKHPEQIITENDLDRRGYLKEGLISVLS